MESVFDVKIEYTIHSFVPSLVATPDFVDNLLDLAKRLYHWIKLILNQQLSMVQKILHLLLNI